MNIKHRDGRLKTERELWKEAREALVSALNNLSEDSQLWIGNIYRSNNREPELHRNTDDELSGVLQNLDTFDILEIGHDYWDKDESYFMYDYWCGFVCTSDVWENADPEDIADAILEGEFDPDLSTLTDIVEDYKDALEELGSYSSYRAKGLELLSKYVNCEASVTDLLQYIDKLVRTDEVWRE